MKAIVFEEYGEADVLRMVDVAPPVPRPDEVLVRVRAAGVDRGAWHLMAGHPRMVRLATGLRRPRDGRLGSELAGTVEAVGSAVTRFAVGDEVLGAGRGAFAELAVARERSLVPRPPGLDPIAAAALPISGVTAVQALRKLGPLRRGQRVLVIGAAGGVGSFAVQIAADAGAEVTGVCSAGKADAVRSLGAHEVIDYRTADPLAPGRTWDLIIDTAGAAPLRRLRAALSAGGGAVIVGSEGTGTAFGGGISRTFLAGPTSVLSSRKTAGLISLVKTEDLAEVVDLAAAERIRPLIDQVLPLERAADAVAHLAAGRARGKTVLRVRD